MISNWQRRWQPLLQQWVMISARSAARPWSGATSSGKQNTPPAHDPDCYLCPRVVRANGSDNPDYTGAFAFDNDFPSLSFPARYIPSEQSLHGVPNLPGPQSVHKEAPSPAVFPQTHDLHRELFTASVYSSLPHSPHNVRVGLEPLRYLPGTQGKQNAWPGTS